MNKLIKSFFILLCILFFSISCDNQEIQMMDNNNEFNTYISVITWNLEFFPKSGNLTIDYVASIFNEYSPDVIALQEVPDNINDNGISLLLDQLPDYSFILGTHTNSELSVAFLYKNNSSFNFINSYELFTTEADYTPFPRSPLVLHMSDEDGNPIYFINNHLKCCDDDGDAMRRWTANQALKNYIDINHPTENIIILGDFNDVYDSTTETRIIIDNLALLPAIKDTLVGFSDSVDYNCFSNFLFYSSDTLLTSEFIDDIEIDCNDDIDACIYLENDIFYYTSDIEVNQIRFSDNNLCIIDPYDIQGSLLYLDDNDSEYSIYSNSTINIFDNFISDSLNYILADDNIGHGHSDYWSYPSYPSHLDHIVLSNELLNYYDNPGTSIQTLLLDLDFNSWDHYDQYISDHRPVHMILTY